MFVCCIHASCIVFYLYNSFENVLKYIYVWACLKLHPLILSSLHAINTNLVHIYGIIQIVGLFFFFLRPVSNPTRAKA
jgi:hypothetical protein